MTHVADAAEAIVSLLSSRAPSNLSPLEHTQNTHASWQALQSLWTSSFNAARSEAARAFLAFGNVIASRKLEPLLIAAALRCATQEREAQQAAREEPLFFTDLYNELVRATAASERSFLAVRATLCAGAAGVESPNSCVRVIDRRVPQRVS